MFSSVKNKVCIITGGAGGIGKQTAVRMLEVGAKVFITDVSDDLVQSALTDLKTLGGVVTGRACNITNFKNVKDMVSACATELGGPDILVNSAGIYKDVLFKDMTAEQWHETIDIDLNGVFYCTKAVSAIMIAQRFGRIISLTSQAAVSGSVLHAHYSAAKAGIIGLTSTLAKELAEYNIRVNCIAPGIIKTPMTASYSPEREEMFYRQIPMQRFGEPDEVAKVVLFLASDLSSYMTGQTINVTGGWLLHS
jgi:3-oxoacyl-[acyl-carrier protein] reductase